LLIQVNKQEVINNVKIKMPGNFIIQGKTREGKDIKVFRTTKALAIKEKIGC